MFRAFLENRRVRKVFGKMVDRETVEKLLAGHVNRTPPTESQIELVLCFVRGDTPEQISERVGRVMEIAAAHTACLDGLTGSVFDRALGLLSQTEFGTAQEFKAAGTR